MSNRARLIGGLLGAVLLALAGCSSEPSKAELDARFVAAWKADPPSHALLGGDSELSISNYGHLIQEQSCTSSDNVLGLTHAIMLDNSPDDVSAATLAISIYCPDRMAAWLGG